MCKKISSAIAALRQVRFLPREALLSIYRALIESRIRYCCTIWGNCNAKLKNRVQKLQNRAARIITNAEPDADNDELLNALNWLNVQQLIDYTAALEIWKAVNGKGPQYINQSIVITLEPLLIISALRFLILHMDQGVFHNMAAKSGIRCQRTFRLQSLWNFSKKIQKSTS